MSAYDLDTVDLPVQVRAMVGTFMREVDIAVPGLVDMLYLVGSAALADYRPGVSDIDFVAVTSRRLGDPELALIADIHDDMPKPPYLDGIYLDALAFVAGPDDEGVVPHSLDGVLRTRKPCRELNPVLWLTLKQCGIAMRGPSRDELDVQVDLERVRAWNLGNLKSYWQPLAHRIRRAMAGRDAAEAAYNAGVMWTVLGPARLHYTLATGKVTSKTDAGRYVAELFPQWSELAELAVECRDGEPIEFVTTDALVAADMIEAIVDDAWLRWG